VLQIALVWEALWSGGDGGQEARLGQDLRIRVDSLLPHLELKRLGCVCP
jgi:hypothetical protein